MKKVLIIGASSCLGSNLATYLRRHYLVYGTYAQHRPRIEDVPCFQMHLDEDTPILGVLKTLRPDTVIYCAGITDTQLCDRDSDLAFALNATFPGTIASAIGRFGSRMIYLSSAKVFSGTKGNYVENDFPDPQDIYGSSKRRGEEILKRYQNVFVLRLPTVFALGSLNQRSMLNRLLRQLWRGEKIACISDETRTFVSGRDLCQAVGLLVDADPIHEGIYHLGSSHSDTYYGFATRLARALGLSTKLISPVSGAHFHGKTVRHRHHDLSLGLGELRKQFGFEPEKPDEAIRRLQLGLKQGVFVPSP
ncbi:MAG: sugar nucleotide-binding protein [Bdellovibrionales bacterium]|nr:sugar nucleotide-binding protein [Bdellovibrionales bacterium]